MGGMWGECGVGDGGGMMVLGWCGVVEWCGGRDLGGGRVHVIGGCDWGGGARDWGA